MAETSEDHISRIGMGLSLKEGAVRQDWRPSQLGVEEVPMTTISGKSIRGKTLFKDDLSLFCALILQHQVPEDYDMWRLILSKHWERGVQLLYQRAIGQKEWLIVITNLLDIS